MTGKHSSRKRAASSKPDVSPIAPSITDSLSQPRTSAAQGSVEFARRPHLVGLAVRRIAVSPFVVGVFSVGGGFKLWAAAYLVQTAAVLVTAGR